MIKNIIICLFIFSFLLIEKSYSSIPISIHKDWTLFEVKIDNDDICYIESLPIQKTGNYKKRGEPYFIVMRKKGFKEDEISLSSGFIFKEKKDVEISILKRKFPLFIDNERAWTYDRNDDIEIVKQMKMGAKLYVTSYSMEDYIANDTYSLIGFNEAYEKMVDLCK